MTTIYSPLEKGFDERLAIIDRCQIALLREIVGQFGAGRLFLKGGMAMRAVFGGMRLTKDIDFDRDPTQSLDSAKGGLRRSMVRAAANA
ncbi:MAG: nucleotidyl transferase AbiEii/AbiGii toxin family protein, partial [Burkholderiales bacterium]